MARSTHIWLVTSHANLVAAFTVKHELVSFLRELFDAEEDFYMDYQVHKFKDGVNNRPHEVNLWDLVE